MTIQNIEDVMDRILTLNRNLTEDSLRTLLSASGWDKEDIMEGVHIFKSKSGKDFSVSSPIPNPTSQNIEDVSKEPPSKIHNTYTFNISKDADSKDMPAVKIETPVAGSSSQEINNLMVNTVENKSVEPVTQDQKAENIPNAIVETNTAEHKSTTNIGKIIFFILLFLILGMLAIYLYSSSFAKFINQKLFGQSSQTENLPSMTLQEPKIASNIYNNATSSALVGTSSTTTITGTQIEDVDIKKLLEEVGKLKAELDAYKKTASAPKTIIKYVSQRGPAGSTGRGITYVEATTTGFILNFTDNTQMIVPYSTTTIFNILNSNSVCFQDQNNISTTSNICLDRNVVLQLLNK
ncbi:MAG: hypothetical protein RI945_206 [Candidatus Parcubacteria bacterium]|jgi:hypothetical protein